MRYLILSDIHANLTALDAALAAAKGHWDKVICLGDVVGYGPDPNEVVDRVREIGAITIRGNHDKAGSGLANADDFNPVARAVALWTREQLRPENREWLEQLPTGPLNENGFVMVHGAFREEGEKVFAPAQALDTLLPPPRLIPVSAANRPKETRAPHSSSPTCQKNRSSSGAYPTISKPCKNAWAPAACPSR